MVPGGSTAALIPSTWTERGAGRLQLSLGELRAFGINGLTHGTQAVVETKDGWPFVLKRFIDEPSEYVDAEETVQSYEIAHRRLGGLVPDFVFIHVTQPIQLGSTWLADETAVIMRKVRLLDLTSQLKEAIAIGDEQKTKTMIRKSVLLIRHILGRGVFLLDAKFDNIGIQDGAFYLLDLGHLRETFADETLKSLLRSYQVNYNELERLAGRELAAFYLQTLKAYGLDTANLKQTLTEIFLTQAAVVVPDISQEVLDSTGVMQTSGEGGAGRGKDQSTVHGPRSTVNGSEAFLPVPGSRESSTRGFSRWGSDPKGERGAVGKRFTKEEREQLIAALQDDVRQHPKASIPARVQRLRASLGRPDLSVKTIGRYLKTLGLAFREPLDPRAAYRALVREFMDPSAIKRPSRGSSRPSKLRKEPGAMWAQSAGGWRGVQGSRFWGEVSSELGEGGGVRPAQLPPKLVEQLAWLVTWLAGHTRFSTVRWEEHPFYFLDEACDELFDVFRVVGPVELRVS
jgi:hypothetical protein